jgi:hypothetical protein
MFTFASGMSQTVNGIFVTNQANHREIKGKIGKTVGANVIPHLTAVNAIFGKNKIQKTHELF